MTSEIVYRKLCRKLTKCCCHFVESNGANHPLSHKSNKFTSTFSHPQYTQNARELKKNSKSPSVGYRRNRVMCAKWLNTNAIFNNATSIVSSGYKYVPCACVYCSTRTVLIYCWWCGASCESNKRSKRSAKRMLVLLFAVWNRQVFHLCGFALCDWATWIFTVKSIYKFRSRKLRINNGAYYVNT